MKENRYDGIMDKALGKVESVTDKISLEFKGANPFDKEKVSTKKMAEHYQGLSNIEKQALIQRHGQVALDYFMELETELFRGTMQW